MASMTSLATLVMLVMPGYVAHVMFPLTGSLKD